jgi:hypothetical protein
MLDSTALVRRCEEEVWSPHDSIREKRELRHFFALYNIVVAVGAFVAGSSITRDFERDIKLCMGRPERSEASDLSLLNQELSKEYFRRSKALLGDVFEVCSLESAQTLLLMVSPPLKIVLEESTLIFHIVVVLSEFLEATRLLYVLWTRCAYCVSDWYRKRISVEVARISQGGTANLVVHLLS